MIPATTMQELKAEGNQTVLVQLPEGLKTKAQEVIKELKAEGFDPIISGDACFGACDLRKLDNATTLHIGHNQFLDDDGGGVVYLPWHHDVSCVEIAEKASKMLPKRVGIVTTVQHIPQLEAVKKVLEDAGHEVIIPDTGRYTRAKGQILGCDTIGAVKIKDKVDGYFYFGSGLFHPIGLAYYTKKHVWAGDPFTSNIEEIDESTFIKEKSLRQTKAMHATSYGIVMSSKPGQYFPKIAESIKQRLEKKGKDVIMIYTDLVSNDTLLAYKVDAFIITACPRIVIDDWKNYSMPILLPDEV